MDSDISEFLSQELEESRMATTDLNMQNLKEILEKVIKELHQKGMLQGLDVVDNEGNVKDEEFLNKIAEKLNGKVNLEALKNDQATQKMLGLVVITEAISNKFPDRKFEFEKFFEPKTSRDEAKQDLQNEFKKLLTAMNDLTNNPKHKLDPDKIDNYVETLSNKVTDDWMKKDKDKLCENDLLTDSIAELTLRTLNGGNDPTKSGEVNYPISGPIMGNVMGFTTQTVQATAKGARTAMDDQGAYNSDKASPPEAMALLGAVSQGITEALEVGLSKGPPKNEPDYMKEN